MANRKGFSPFLNIYDICLPLQPKYRKPMPEKEPLPDNLEKPGIFTTDEGLNAIAPGMPYRKILKYLKGDQKVCFTGTYGFALSFYSWLKKRHNQRFPIKDYPGSRENREQWHRLAQILFLPVKDHSPALEKAPVNPWLKEFYPDTPDYFMGFSDFLGMNGAWQWYDKGIRFPVLEHRLHPFYGVYFPTRFEHLELFEKWLRENHTFPQALDIGTGCGILTFIMLKYGIQKVHATDINPNAIWSTGQDLRRQNLQSRVRLEKAEWAGSFRPQSNNLVVFNPPWIPYRAEKTIDQASYYHPGFFEEFFSRMEAACPAGTTLLMLFSDFAQVAGITREHPLESLQNLQKGFILKEKVRMPVKQPPSIRKSWIAEIRSKEKIELWVFKRE